MDKNFIGFMLVFALVIAASLAFANTDQITPVVAEAQADAAIGAPTVQVVEQGASLILKLLVGATVAGIAAAVFAEVRKAYKTWQRNSLRKRWTTGPNAQWRQQQPMPKLRREDLMLLALSGRLPADSLRTSPRRGSMRVQDEEQDIDLEMPL